VKFCKRNPGFMDSVRLGAVRAIDECQYQFRALRWNCSTLQETYNKQVNFIKAQLGSKMADGSNNNNNQLSEGLAALGYPGLSTSSVYSRAALAAPRYPRQFNSLPEPTMNAMLSSHNAFREKNNSKGGGGGGGGGGPERKRNSRNTRNERRRGRSSSSSKCK
jgi:hypothetical protein